MLYVDRKDLKLPKGHYLVQDLIGITIVDADDGDKVYGTLTDVSQTGANAVYHMQTEKGEVLIPAIPDVVVEINLKKDILRLRPMKGLLDDDEI
jgi:16S rRNA processing protein RimM